MAYIIRILCILILLSSSAWAVDECGVSAPFTCTSWSDLEDCVEGDHDTCSNFQDGDTINIATGSYTRTSTITISDPMTIDGGGNYAINATTWADEGTWPVTVNSSSASIAFNVVGSAGDSIRLTGIKFTGSYPSGGGVTGAITIAGTNASNSWVIDNCFFSAISGNSITNRWGYGVIHSCYFYRSSGQTSGGNVKVRRTLDDTDASGEGCHVAFMDAVNFGSDEFTFVEDSTFYAVSPSNGSSALDTARAGKVVVRYNKFYNHFLSTHNISYTYSRGGMAYELYENDLNHPSDTWTWTAFAFRAGTAVIHNNTFTNYQTIFRIQGESRGSSWGTCDGSHPWDGNEVGGCPCLDSPGRSTASGSSFVYSPESSDIQTQLDDPIRIWSNNSSTVDLGSGGASGCTTLNDNIFISADDTAARPAYTVYTYPHPLREEAVEAKKTSTGVSWQ